MRLAIVASAVARPGMIATIIVAVLASSAFLGWMAWQVFKSAERAERDPRYLRRRLLSMAMLYIGCAVFAIAQVATGKEPIKSLIGLPIGVMFIWMYLRAAIRVKAPPREQAIGKDAPG
jgi:threonine/homoserine/homoserine lactone efflux protein